MNYPKKPTEEQLEVFRKYYEGEILVLQKAIFESLNDEQRKDPANYTWRWCPAYYDKEKKPGECLTPVQNKIFLSPWEALRHGCWVGAYPPEGFIYRDHDKPSDLYDDEIQKTHGHFSKKKHCGHTLHKTALKLSDVKNKTYDYPDLGFQGEICRHGKKPVWPPGTAKGMDQVITHRSNSIAKWTDFGGELEARIKSESEEKVAKIGKGSKKTYPAVQDKEGATLEEGGRNYFLVIAIGRRLRDLGICHKDMNDAIDFANRTFCHPPVDEGKARSIHKQMKREARQEGLRSRNRLIWVDREDGAPDTIRKSLKALGWDFRTLRGGIIQWRRFEGQWKEDKLRNIVDKASEECEAKIRLVRNIRIEKIYNKEKPKLKADSDRKDEETEIFESRGYWVKTTMAISEFSFNDKKVEKCIRNWAFGNFHDKFRIYIAPFKWDARRLARQYGYGNWKDTQRDGWIIWRIMDMFTQRHSPRDKQGIVKYDKFIEDPEEYAVWQQPLIMLQAIWRLLNPGYSLTEFLWNFGPEGSYKNRSRELLLPASIREDMYNSNLVYTQQTEAKVNRQRRCGVFSEFDEAETMKHADLKRYFTAGKVLHEAKYEEINERIPWMDVPVFSTNKFDALPPTDTGNRRFVPRTQFLDEKHAKRIENGESKAAIDKEIQAMFDEHRDVMWTQALALYLMKIPPAMPEGLEVMRVAAVQNASGLTEIRATLVRFFIQRILEWKDDDSGIAIKEVAKMLNKSSRAISPEMRKIHVEFGGDGKTITERHGGDPMACYPIKTLQIPPHYKDLAREIKKSLQGPLGGMKKPEEVIAERRQKKDEECNHKSGDKDYFTGA